MATSCIGVEYPLVAFRCDPQQQDNCPETHFCCSDDPAAAGGAKPNYSGKNISDSATPYFSGDNNALSRSGMCVRVDDIAGQGLIEFPAANCPIPCNPTWDPSWIDDVCGPARVCCQTVALEAADCINDGSGFRPVDGDDIVAGLSAWRPADHATHQDPNGSGCLLQAGNDPQSAAFEDCIRQLSVANQRGFCMALQAGQTCPTEQPGFIDACTQLNGGVAPPA
ncbi:MAG: hypothetical protein KDK70_08700 [Myxococcales bacterium]|nr:hypothetical protein [Myxococcales bacterium]